MIFPSKGTSRKECRSQSEFQLSNLKDVRHLDLVVVDAKSKGIRAICEVKSTAVEGRKDFHMNGECPDVTARAAESWHSDLSGSSPFQAQNRQTRSARRRGRGCTARPE